MTKRFSSKWTIWIQNKTTVYNTKIEYNKRAITLTRN